MSQLVSRQSHECPSSMISSMSSDPMEPINDITSDTEAETGEEEPGNVDNFYSPYNQDFYQHYKYDSLDPARQQIRLLRVEIGDNIDNSTPIRCELLDGKYLGEVQGIFSTISYCAGDPKDTEEVIVNGLPFNAFARLGHALRQARWFWTKKRRGDYHECFLWADQICINQSDLLERSHQVGFMDEIYAGAEQVLVSLTREGQQPGGLVWLRSLLRMDRSPNRPWEQEPPVAKLSCPQFRKGRKAFIRAFIDTPYWTRAWVRQEFALSRKSHFLAAFDCCNEVQLRSLTWYSDHIFTDYECTDCAIGYRRKARCPCMHPCTFEFSNSREGYLAMESLFAAKRAAEYGMTLPQCIASAGLCEASDPRDMIYALMGVASDGLGLEVTYSTNVTFVDVYCDLAQRTIYSLGHLGIVNRSSWTRISVQLSGYSIPSWLPDFFGMKAFRLAGPEEYSQGLPYIERVAEFVPDLAGRKNWELKVRGCFLDLYAVKAEIWWIYGSCKYFILKKFGHGQYKLKYTTDSFEVVHKRSLQERFGLKAQAARIQQANEDITWTSQITIY